MAKSTKKATTKKSATPKQPPKKVALAKAPPKPAPKLAAEATAASATTRKSAPITDDAKRLARNARLREWRAAHADEQRAYMADWRAKRKGANSTTARRSSPAAKSSAIAPTAPAEDVEKGGES